MASEFKSWLDFFRFAERVRRGRRHVLDAESRDFLEVVRVTSKARVLELQKGTTICRAQNASTRRSEYGYLDEDEPKVEIAQWAMPCSEKRLRPYPDRAKEGRANVKGVPVFYGAMDEDTAISEMRAWKGAFVSIGFFKTVRPLRLVDCSRHADTHKPESKLKYAMSKNNPAMKEEGVWLEIEEAFATPVLPSDKHADYVPTQILSELFMDAGYDGLLFKSSVGPGKNVVLFCLNQVDWFEARIARITGIKVDFDMGGYDGIELRD